MNVLMSCLQVFEALTKRTRSDTVATKLTRVKDSALARRIWVDKVCTALYCSCSVRCGCCSDVVLIAF